MARKRKNQPAPPSKGWKRFSMAIVLVFGLAASVIAYNLALTFIRTIEARSWQEVPATLVEWSITKTASNTIGRSFPPKPMQRLSATYRYAIDGQPYTGTQVGLVPVNDNFSDRYRDAIITQLRNAEAHNAPLTIWVDPKAPERAVISRDLPTAHALFYALLLILPCGIATVTFIGSIFALLGRITGRTPSRLTVPCWLIAHGSPAIAITVLAPSGTIGLGNGILLAMLFAMMVAGVVTLWRAAPARTVA